jgi:hypothetical protein
MTDAREVALGLLDIQPMPSQEGAESGRILGAM